MFAAGGFLFLNERGLVLGVQALVTGEGYDNQLVFGAPQTWRREFTEQVRPPRPPPYERPVPRFALRRSLDCVCSCRLRAVSNR